VGAELAMGPRARATAQGVRGRSPPEGERFSVVGYRKKMENLV